LDVSQSGLASIRRWVPEGELAGGELVSGIDTQGVVLLSEVTGWDVHPVCRVRSDQSPEKEGGQ
jgi:hypothetical protein